MQDVTVDFETYFAKDYSLKDMTMREYILDDRFQPIVLGVATEDDRFTLQGHEIQRWVNSVNWSQVRLSGHNLQFDAAILRWHFKAEPPALYECTQFMAQASIGHAVGGSSLEIINEVFGMSKDSGALTSMKGMRYEDIDWASSEAQRYMKYACQDAVDSFTHAKYFRKNLPQKAKLVIHLIVRMYVDTGFVLDLPMLKKNLKDVKLEADRVLSQAGVNDRKEISSREKFAELLKLNGVEPPVKISERTGKETYAFSKKDIEFVKLQSHQDPKIRTLVEAKLNASSTLEETRTARFIKLAELGDRLNVPLNFSGAHTHRFSGRDSLNLQNLPRGSELRNAMKAPRGYKIVVIDASQIEARVLAWLAGCEELVNAFANGEDVYSVFASKIFGFQVNKKDHPKERFLGKTGILGLGYGTGADKFFLTVLLAGQEISYDFAQQTVRTYRQGYPEIPLLWRRMDEAILSMISGTGMEIGPVSFHNKLWTTIEGLPVVYPSLRVAPDPGSGYGQEFEFWRHRYKSFERLYGAKLTENVVQHLSWLQIVETMVKMHVTNPDWMCLLQVHDELAYLAPEDEAEDCYNCLMKFMCEQPPFASAKQYPIPLAAEGDIADRYGEAK